MRECDIVQDLLIGYSDNTLRDGSKEFVEKHLKECKSCMEVLQIIQDDKIEKNSKIEIDYLKKMRKKNNVKNILLTILGIISLMFIIISVLSFENYYRKLGMEIFVEDNITDEQMENIEKIIKEIDKNANIEHITQDNALKQMKEKLGKENEKMLEGYENMNIFPASLKVKSNRSNLIKIEKLLEKEDGVKSITSTVKLNPYVLFYFEVFVK